MSALDTQIGGDHYKHLAIQPMEYSMKNGLDACQHTAIKYITRFREKGGISDLEKAKHCIDMLIEFERQRVGEEVVNMFVEDVLAHGPISEADPYGPRDAEGWYTWNGDETMRPAGEVEIQIRDGGDNEGAADQFDWRHRKSTHDIVKWRPAQ